MRTGVFLALATLSAGAARAAADLPEHAPLRILVVSDRVNPHNLPPEELTEPGDISAALLGDTGLNLSPTAGAVTEIGTDQIEQATALLSVPQFDPNHFDVLVYFSHRRPDGDNAQERQDAFVAAVELFLERGGGVVSFHHGSYLFPGKDGILSVIGGAASGSVTYDTMTGQNVINVAPGHFVTENGMAYEGTSAYTDLARGVPADDYTYFNNTPDERYPTFDLLPTAGDTIEMLFASDYNENGTQHVLGFTHWRPGWCGYVVAYQPGEYQPNALDDLDGNNFQVLANAIVYSTGALTPAPDGVELSVNRGVDGAVELDWAVGPAGPYTVYRTNWPRGVGVTQPCNRLGETAGLDFEDTPLPAGVHYYRVEAP